MNVAYRQGAHLDCDEFLDQFTDDFVLEGEVLARFVTAGTIAHPGATETLMEYWTHGKGAAKIRWGTDGSFARCVRHLRKYFPKNPEGLCANLHHRATGEWPTEHGKLGIPS